MNGVVDWVFIGDCTLSLPNLTVSGMGLTGHRRQQGNGWRVQKAKTTQIIIKFMPDVSAAAGQPTKTVIMA